jgi:glycosyltransferase involved in cell wall biosynthesis
MVSAHGYLERWAFREKSWKKKPYTWLVERQTLNRAACLRALTRTEIDDYRRIGVSAPIALIPNGVSIPEDTSSNEFLEKFPELRDKSLVLFLGRIHHKKGLDILCHAWADRSRRDHHLVIAGPKDSPAFRQIKSLVGSLGIERSVTFTGMLQGGMKWSALAASDLFVLASRGEGFSMAALEAAGMGVPLLLSDCCNFPEVADLQCGWVVRPEIGAVAEALGEACDTSSSKREEMSHRCQKMIQDRYTWKAIARQMSEVYQGLLAGTGPIGAGIFN